MNLHYLAFSDTLVAPTALGGLGAVAAVGFWLAARWGRRLTIPLRVLATVAGTWLALCLGYILARVESPFTSYLISGTLVTELVAAIGAACYVVSLLTHRASRRPWRRSSGLVAGLALMAAAFLRAAYQPSITLAIEVPLAVIFVATVWRLRAEFLVYLAILAVALTTVLAAREPWAGGATGQAAPWIMSTAAGISLLMVLAAALMGLVRSQKPNVRWYRQGLMIVPLVGSSLAAIAAGYMAAWYGPSWHTVWTLGVWWAVLLVSSIGLRQPDLFGFSSVGLALAAVATFAVLGGDRVAGYWGRYPPVLLVIGLGAALLSSLLRYLLARRPTEGFARALYLVAAAIAVTALVVEPLNTTAKFLGIDMLGAALVLLLAHLHRAPSWVNYLIAGLITAGVAPLVHLSPGAPPVLWHHRFILVTAWAAVAWVVVALTVREVLRRVTSDRTARHQSLPFTILGMGTAMVLAVYLGVQQWIIYAQFITTGKSDTLPLVGPAWGLGGWIAVLLAWTLSMWLVRHTARTFLFYCFGISAVLCLGLFDHTDDLYGYLIYAVAGYGAAHLLVYLYEQKFMALLSRSIALYREEPRASTTIFTLAVFSCFGAAILAAFRLNAPGSLIMLAIMAAVFLAWAFLWQRGVMLYPAILMVTLTTLAIWHNIAHPVIWDAGRLAINAGILTISAFVWLAIGKGLDPVRAEVFQLAAPARACSVILAVIGTGFVAVMAVSSTFSGAIWRQPRSAWDWTLGLTAVGLLVGYYAVARFAFERRFYSLMSAFGLLLLGLYVGIYIGIHL
jgi:hypothetical protein